MIPDLHKIICKYNMRAIYALLKEQLIKYNWEYLIKYISNVVYDLPMHELMTMHNSFIRKNNI